MNAELEYFEAIRRRFQSLDEAVNAGRMMSSPAICYRGKVFAFFATTRMMVFRLGKDFDPEQYGCKDITPFNPFKNKGPLGGWYQVPYVHRDQWEALTRAALHRMKHK